MDDEERDEDHWNTTLKQHEHDGVAELASGLEVAALSDKHEYQENEGNNISHDHDASIVKFSWQRWHYEVAKDAKAWNDLIHVKVSWEVFHQKDNQEVGEGGTDPANNHKSQVVERLFVELGAESCNPALFLSISSPTLRLALLLFSHLHTVLFH